jgi:hypothetical protein
MKGYIFSTHLFLLSLLGMAQKANEVKKKEFIKKETPKVQFQYGYDLPHCDIGVFMIKMVKPLGTRMIVF